MKMPSTIQVTEADIKEFFAETKDAVRFLSLRHFNTTHDLGQITKINFPTHPGRAKLAYVEFVDETGMKTGLEKHAEVCFFFFPYFGSLLPHPTCYRKSMISHLK